MTLPNSVVLSGQTWKHKNGDHYRIVTLANYNASPEKSQEYPVTVVYERVKDRTVWSRPLDRWHASFTPVTLESF